jgi:hypothetical protein
MGHVGKQRTNSPKLGLKKIQGVWSRKEFKGLLSSPDKIFFSDNVPEGI